jgi:hypothetical protein
MHLDGSPRSRSEQVRGDAGDRRGDRSHAPRARARDGGAPDRGCRDLDRYEAVVLGSAVYVGNGSSPRGGSSRSTRTSSPRACVAVQQWADRRAAAAHGGEGGGDRRNHHCDRRTRASRVRRKVGQDRDELRRAGGCLRLPGGRGRLPRLGRDRSLCERDRGCARRRGSSAVTTPPSRARLRARAQPAALSPHLPGRAGRADTRPSSARRTRRRGAPTGRARGRSRRSLAGSAS